MPEHAHHGPPDTSQGFEQSDLSLKGITTGVVFYFIFTALVGLAVVIFMAALHASGPPQAATTELKPRLLPASPNPLLQNGITARTDIWNLRAREDFLLHNYSWVDQANGIVRIPIDAAIDKVAAKGPGGLILMPSTAPTPPTPSSPAGLPKPPVAAGGMAPNSLSGQETVPRPPPLPGHLPGDQGGQPPQ